MDEMTSKKRTAAVVVVLSVICASLQNGRDFNAIGNTSSYLELDSCPSTQ